MAIDLYTILSQIWKIHKAKYSLVYIMKQNLTNSQVYWRSQVSLQSLIGDEVAFAMNGEVNTHNVVHYTPAGQPPVFKVSMKSRRL